MFEAAEVGRSISKSAFKSAEIEVRARMLELQGSLRASDKSLIVIVSGVEGAGKGEVVDQINRWFDTRDVRTHGFWNETDEERERPRFWRFWRTLPARGSVSIMFGSWYTQPIIDRALETTNDANFEEQMLLIEELERELYRDGAIFVKLWFHLSAAEQQKRLEADANSHKLAKKSPLLDEFAQSYAQFRKVSERAIRLTDSGFATWHIIEASDKRYRDLTTGNVLIKSLERALGDASDEAHKPEANTDSSSISEALAERKSTLTALDNVDPTLSLSEEEYKQQLNEAQANLYRLSWAMHNQNRNAVLVFEGWDAAGKGSAIRRLTQAMDARLYNVIPIASPSDEEKAHHYLWRFWRHIPRSGYMTIYDRSWYGRVLVERVEGFAEEHEWRRSYEEINNFEEHLIKHGTTVIKFWINISFDEQLRRFQERQQIPWKQHKITEEDWRNREKWEDYKLAVNDMVAHTSTEKAPWVLVAGNDKKYARVQILNTVCKRLEAALSPD